MRVALVSSVSSYPSYRSPGQQIDPPMGILSLATVLRRDHDVRIFDGQLFRGTPRRMAAQVLEWRPDVVGFSVNFSTLAHNSREMAEYLRREAPDVVVVFGGNFATFNWTQLARHPYVDYVVLHEAEHSFRQLCRSIEERSDDVPVGVIDCRGGTNQRPSFGGYITDLDTLPFSDFELFDHADDYVKSLVSSRGCPYTCVYCSTREMWQKWRMRSASNVAREMLGLVDRYGTNQVLFADDTFLVREDRARELGRILVAETGGSLHWGFSTRLETIRAEFIPELARAGVRWIFFGCESGSDRVLRLMQRHYSRAEMLHKIRLCADNGITCTASFIVGLPWETEEDVRFTFDAMRGVATHRVLLNIFTPLAGTASINDAGKLGIRLLEGYDPERGVIGHGAVSHETPHLTSEQIKALWLEGQGIVMEKGRQKPRWESEIQRNRFGLLGAARGVDESRHEWRYSHS